jgi:hypothetical protein
MSLKEQISTKTTNGNIKEAFRNEEGAIDLASIMVGIIVIGLIGGVIAATVFAVIPWAQDNAAKQQLDAVVTAQSAKAGMNDGKYSTDLGSFLDTSAAKIAVRSNGSDCYGAFVTSSSGNSYYVSSAKSQPVKIAANATWPTQKPSGYPVNCAWPSTKEGAVVVPAQNYVLNSSFEVNDANLVSVGDATNKAVSRVQSPTAHSGDYIVQVKRIKTGGNSLAYAFWTSDLEPGNYVSSLRMRASTPLSVYAYNESAVYTDANVPSSSRPTVELNGEWKTVYSEFRVDTKTSKVKAGFLQTTQPAEGGEIIEIDSVQVVKATGNLTKDTTFTDF